ncbi:MAG: hypothetical protein ACE5K4_05465 [Candidatus Hydrothermarchaeota archaeon]
MPNFIYSNKVHLLILFSLIFCSIIPVSSFEVEIYTDKKSYEPNEVITVFITTKDNGMPFDVSFVNVTVESPYGVIEVKHRSTRYVGCIVRTFRPSKKGLYTINAEFKELSVSRNIVVSSRDTFFDDLKKLKKPVEIIIFSREKCAECPLANKIVENAKIINSEKINVRGLDIDMSKEAVELGISTSPTVLINREKKIVGWHGYKEFREELRQKILEEGGIEKGKKPVFLLMIPVFLAGFVILLLFLASLLKKG